MDIRAQLLQEHSKKNCDLIVAWVGDSQKRFDELFTLFISNEYRVAQRSAWPVSYCVAAHPKLMEKKFSALIKNLGNPAIHDAVRRNSIRLLQDISIPKKYQGAIMDICFGYMAAPKETVAVKAYSLTVLENLSKQYPEISPELVLLIEEQMPRQTLAFTSRAKKILKPYKKRLANNAFIPYCHGAALR